MWSVNTPSKHFCLFFKLLSNHTFVKTKTLTRVPLMPQGKIQHTNQLVYLGIHLHAIIPHSTHIMLKHILTAEIQPTHLHTSST